jgi:hypothetical protein
VRPVWHQRGDRVEAHILVCFLAFVLWKTLEMWQSRAGLGNSPRTIIEELKRIQSHDVVLPTATLGQITGRAARSPRHRPAKAHAHRRTRAPGSCRQRLEGAPQSKCSGDFLAKALICLNPTLDSAQVGLAQLAQLGRPRAEILDLGAGPGALSCRPIRPAAQAIAAVACVSQARSSPPSSGASISATRA